MSHHLKQVDRPTFDFFSFSPLAHPILLGCPPCGSGLDCTHYSLDAGGLLTNGSAGMVEIQVEGSKTDPGDLGLHLRMSYMGGNENGWRAEGARGSDDIRRRGRPHFIPRVIASLFSRNTHSHSQNAHSLIRLFHSLSFVIYSVIIIRTLASST